ncbi:MAG: ABC transporter permease/substrate-binding protein, partial [Thermoleophilaceae bacterium]
MNDFTDAIDFIFNSRETNEGVEVGGSQFLELAIDHMWLSLVAVVIACATAIPLGLWLGHIGRGGFIAINASNVGRAVPSLALIAFFVAYLGVGFANVTLALVLLAVPPILTNTYVGVRQVDRDTVDAARGMGMTGTQIIRRVELPLSLPLIFGGIRTSAVNVVATATLAPLAGLSSLGDPIINVSTYGDDGRLGAAILVAFLAVATELSLAALQRASTPKGIRRRRKPMKQVRYATALIAVLLSALALAACGDDDDDDGGNGGETSAAKIERNDANSGIEITVGSKNFTEQKVLGEIYAQGLEAAGFTVDKELNLGDEKTALKAVNSGEIDAYPEYTGTALLSFFGVAANEIPKDPATAFEDAKAGFEDEGLTAYPPTPFTSSNEVGLTQEKAEELGVATISDLADHDQDMTLYGSPECRQRTDCLLGLQQVYGLDFK